MYINDRDQINYHGFLKKLRRSQKVTLNQVSEGICSYSELSRTEIGDRLPEKLMRDRITSRLGISSEEYEEYLRPEEFRQWECRMRILNHINKGNLEDVYKEIEVYNRIMERNPVQEQFVETMRYMHGKMRGAPTDTLCLMLELAILHTVPNIRAAFAGAQLLADQELNLILEYTYLREFSGKKENEFEWRLAEYKKILKYVDESYMDVLSKSKIYPKVTYYVCEWILKERPSYEYLKYAFELCDKSIELLRSVSRLYYFIELLESRQEIIERILQYSEVDERTAEQLNGVKERDLQWETTLKELYRDYEVPIYMQNFTYLYVETECNSAVEVIRIRRQMVKLSRAKVSKNICTEKTVERFEKYENSPSIVVIRDIFEKIGLCAEYRRARVISNDSKALALWNETADCFNSWKNKEVELCLNNLESKLHMNIRYNKQEIERLRNLLAYRNGQETAENLYRNAMKILEYTIPFSAIIRKEEIYLTRTEWSCIYALAFKTKGEVSNTCLDIIQKICEKALDSDVPAAKLGAYETIMGEFASYLSDIGKYKESRQLSEKLLKECLSHRRLIVLVDNLYNNVWTF